MTDIPAHCVRPGVYFALRRMRLPWWSCMRIMWHGAELSVRHVETGYEDG